MSGQKDDGQLHVTIETADSSGVPTNRVRQKLAGMLEGYPVEIELADRINGNLAGKHRWIVSDLVGTG